MVVRHGSDDVRVEFLCVKRDLVLKQKRPTTLMVVGHGSDDVNHQLGDSGVHAKQRLKQAMCC